MDKYELSQYNFSRIITKDFCKLAVSEMDYDLGHGVFDKFPKVKRMFEIIYLKLQKMVYVKNAEGLNSDDLLLMIENDYIRL